jgi:hypothetical protein
MLIIEELKKGNFTYEDLLVLDGDACEGRGCPWPADLSQVPDALN